MKYQLDAACLCTMGKVRRNNEDNFSFDGQSLEAINRGLASPLRFTRPLAGEEILCVFDGMGGENYGELASYEAAQQLKRELEAGGAHDEAALTALCLRLNEAVFAQAQELLTERMGTTVVGFAFTPERVLAFNLGDSRAYRLRGGELTQLSEDHVARRGSGKKSPLTQHLGIDPEELLLEPTVTESALEAGDRYLLCSDGLTDMLEDAQIAALLGKAASAAEAAETLIAAALEAGGKDNVTAIVCRIL